MSPVSSAQLRETMTAGLVLLILTTLLTWPAAIRFSDGITDNLDAEFNAWVLDWDRHQLLSDTAHLFVANIFSPARYSLAFSENLLGWAVFVLPFLTFAFFFF